MKLENYFNHAKKYIKYGMLSFLLLSAIFFTGCPQSNNNKPAVHTETAVLMIKEIKMQAAGQGAVTVRENVSNPIWAEGKITLAFLLADDVKPRYTNLFLTAGGKSVDVRKSKDRFIAEVKGSPGETIEIGMSCTCKGKTDKRSFSIEFRSPNEGTITLTKFELVDKDGSQDITSAVMPPNNPQWRVWDKSTNTLRFAGEADVPLSKILVNGSMEKARINLTDSKKFEFEYTFPLNTVQPISVMLSAEGYKDFYFNFAFVFNNKPNVAIEIGKKDDSGNFMQQAVIDEQTFFAGKLITAPVYEKTPIVIRISGKSAYQGDKITGVTANGTDVPVTENSEGSFAEYTLRAFAGEADEEENLTLKIEAETRGEKPVARESVELNFKFIYQALIACKDFLIDDGNGFVSRSGNYRCRRPDVKLKMIFDTDISSINLTEDYLYSASTAPKPVPKFTISGKEAVLELNLPDTGMDRVEIPVTVKADGHSDTFYNFNVRYSATVDKLIVGFAPFEMGHVSGSEPPVVDADGNIIKPLTVYLKHSSTTLYALTVNAWKYTSIKVNGVECLGKPAFSDPLKIVKSAENSVDPPQFPGAQPNVNAILKFENLEKNKPYELEIELGGTDEVGEALLPSKLYGGKFIIMHK